MIKLTDEKIKQLIEVLYESWSIESSSKWTKENPAAGQCGVTALVMNDFLGGEILKTKLEEGWHYYNRIQGRNIDFTQSQFEELPKYEHRISNRQEAFSDTNNVQYGALKNRVYSALVKRGMLELER